MFPDANANDAANAVRHIFHPGILSGWQMIAETITEIKVIKKFIGRISFIVAVSFSVNSIKVLLRDSPKLTKRKRFICASRVYNLVILSALSA
jgi:hypothetical protein